MVADRSADTAGPTLVEVWAPWCSACRAMRRDFESVAAAYRGRVRVERLDASQGADTLGVRATPTLIGYVGDDEVFRVAGRRTRRELEELFEQLSEGSAAARSWSATDVVVRLGAGTVLAVIGLLAGPAWPLVAIGAAVCASGVWPVVRAGRR